MGTERNNTNNDLLDYASERMKQIKESLRNERSNAEFDKLRPINIDLALGNEQL